MEGVISERKLSLAASKPDPIIAQSFSMSDNSLPDVTSPTDVTSLHEVKDDVTFLFINHWCHYYGLSGDVRRRLLKAHTEQQLHIASLTPSLIRQLEMPPAESQVLRGAMLQYLSLKKEVDDHICRQIVTEQYGEEGVYKKGGEFFYLI